MIARVIVALAAAASVAGAQREPAIKSCVPADTTLEHARWASPETSPKRADVDALERRLKTAPQTSMPAVLLALGRLKARYSPDAKYARAHSDEYFFNEVAGQWLYTGWHFIELRRRFPRNKLADDAAWEETFLPVGAECEEYVPCQVSALWMQVEPFLRAHPTSPYADSAVARTLLAFSAITPRLNLRETTRRVDPPEIRKLVDELESVAHTLQPRHRVTLLARVAEIREQLGDYPGARRAARLAADLRAGEVSECVAEHLKRIEIRLTKP